jgi:colanic acid/amylovoran biosynthesis protein
VTFLSTCQGVPEYWTDDSRFAAQLVAELLPGEPNIHVDTSFRTPEQLAEALRGFDVAIATRMHFAILALAVATPVVAIAYEFKSRELLRAMGREAWAFDIEEVSSEGLLRATREALAGGDALRAGIAAQVDRVSR